MSERMRIQQTVTTPCAMCMLISQLREISESDKQVYQRHLWREHGIQPYFVPR
jgi:hypothetical protein